MGLFNFYSLSILLILSFVNSKNIDKNKETCECALNLKTDKKIDKTNTRLWEHSVKDLKTKDCEEAKVLCVNSCKQIIKSELNDLNLQTQHKEVSNSIKFGQYLCNKLGFDVNNTVVSLFVALNCNSVKSNRIEDETITLYTNIDSKEYLNCKHGMFESDHTLNPINFYSDSNRIENFDEDSNWNMFCRAAKNQNNINFKCIDDIVYYFEPNSEKWSEARKLCSQKFGATQFADLVELSDTQLIGVKAMIYDILIQTKEKTDDSAVDIWTNGVCCFGKRQSKSNTLENNCEWISSRKQIEDHFISDTESKCSALLMTIRLNTNKDVIFNIKGYNEVNSDTKSPYLCTYVKPH